MTSDLIRVTANADTVWQALREAPAYGPTIDGAVDAQQVARRLRSHGVKVSARGMGARLNALVRGGHAERRYYSEWRLWLYRALETRPDAACPRHLGRGIS